MTRLYLNAERATVQGTLSCQQSSMALPTAMDKLNLWEINFSELSHWNEGYFRSCANWRHYRLHPTTSLPTENSLTWITFNSKFNIRCDKKVSLQMTQKWKIISGDSFISHRSSLCRSHTHRSTLTHKRAPSKTVFKLFRFHLTNVIHFLWLCYFGKSISNFEFTSPSEAIVLNPWIVGQSLCRVN